MLCHRLFALAVAACLVCVSISHAQDAPQPPADVESPSPSDGTVQVEDAAAEPGVAVTGCDVGCTSCATCGCSENGCTSGCKTCTCKDKKAAMKKAAGAYKGVFYANDYSYLCDPCYDGCLLGDNLKRMSFGDCWTVDVGGQYRMRFHSEQNIRNSGAVTNGLGLTGNDDDFLLHRTRLFANVEYGSNIRFYGEMLDANSEFESNGATRPIEENRAEMQNMFAEIRNIGVGCGTGTARIGRQEISLGAQRLVSPLDWANTRRTFDGARFLYEGNSWDLDAFWLRPMKRDGAHRTKLDAPNLDRQLYGVYGTYKDLCRDNLEAYWLALDYDDVGGGIRYDTIGARYWGQEGDWLYDFEGGVQFGENRDGSDHSAGFVTAGFGRKFECAPLSPTVWLWYDWTSGDDTPGNGFHHYEPLAHKYLGFMDIFGRSNIQDINLQATMAINEKTKLLFWYHYLTLANTNDVPYNITMTPFAGMAAGSSGSSELGHEVDIVLSHTLTPRSTIVLGYSHFFAGNYYSATAGVPYDGEASFVYTQWHVNF